MKGKKLFWGFIIIALILIPLLYLGFKHVYKAPAIETTTIKTVDLNNSPVTIGNNNKHVIVSIWATWCGTCINEMPELVSLKKELNPAEWDVVLISDEELNTINTFVQKKQYDLTFLKATNQFKELGITRYPTTYIFDKNGKLKFQRNGKLAVFRSEFDEVIKHLSKGSGS